jgi:hypothetical protein
MLRFRSYPNFCVFSLPDALFQAKPDEFSESFALLCPLLRRS